MTEPVVATAVTPPAKTVRTARNRPSVSVRPAAVGAVNGTALLIADAVALGGPVAWVVAGAVAVGGAGVAGSRMRRASRDPSARTKSRGAPKSPRAGLMSRLRPSSSATGKTTGRGPTLGGTTSGRKPPSTTGARGPAVTSPTGKRLAKVKTAARRAKDRTKVQAQRARAKTAKLKARRLAKITDPGYVAKQKAKQATKAAKQKAKKRGANTAIKKPRGIATKTVPPAGATTTGPAARRVAGQPNPAPATRAPGSAPTTAPTMTGGSSMGATMQKLIDLAEQMQAIAKGYEPDGMLEVLGDYRQLPQVLDGFAAALGTFHEKAEAWYPLKPVIIELIDSTRRHQTSTARASDEIAPTINSLHRHEIEATSDPKNEMWAPSKNRDHA